MAMITTECSLHIGLCNMTKYSMFHIAQSFFFRLIMVIFFFMPCVLHRILREGNTNKHECDTES